MQPITQAKIDPNLSDIRQLRAAQEFFWSDRLFRPNHPETLATFVLNIFIAFIDFWDGSIGLSGTRLISQNHHQQYLDELVLIPNGMFQMGSPIEEEKAANDEWQHQVTISKDYYLGVMEVTQGQYAKVMRTNLSHFQKRVICKSDGSMYPVETVSW